MKEIELRFRKQDVIDSYHNTFNHIWDVLEEDIKKRCNTRKELIWNTSTKNDTKARQ